MKGRESRGSTLLGKCPSHWLGSGVPFQKFTITAPSITVSLKMVSFCTFLRQHPYFIWLREEGSNLQPIG